MSAAHVLNVPLYCEGTFIDAPTVELVNDSVGDPMHGTRVVADNIRLGEASEGDVALLSIPAEQVEELDDFNPVPIRDTQTDPLQPGEIVYTFGYGAADLIAPSDTDQRTPRERALSPEHQAMGYATPWVIGGVVLSVSTEGEVVIITGLQDYTNGSRRPEASIGHGDSGGPVIDALGRYAGAISKGSSEGDLDELEDLSHVDPVGLPSDYDPSFGVIQSVDAASIDRLKNKTPVDCTPPRRLGDR